ncbi:hypothetical protein IPM65_01170 [Candidatus Roizmanbacteria bacterium]|nr:MAG: hypothetical protein IPM65_01170 [Candidatus Roizmanbacteria bacterium]
MENSDREEWQEELKYLEERLTEASSEAKQEIQKRINELKSRLEETAD